MISPLRVRVLLSSVLLLAVAEARSAPQGANKQPFQEQWLRPYLQKGPVRAARQYLQAGQHARAASVLRKHLERRDAEDPLQARYLLAHSLLRGKQFDEAARIFHSLSRTYPLLKDYHLLHRATALYGARKFSQAEGVLGSISEGSTLSLEVSLLRARILEKLGRRPAAAQQWRQYLKARPRGPHAAEGLFRLGRILESGAPGRKATREQLLEALRCYKEITVIAPTSRQAKQVKARLAALSRRVRGGRAAAELSSWERYSQAMKLYNAMRNRQAEKALEALTRTQGLSWALRCKVRYHQAKSVFRQRQRARAEPLFRAAESACRQAGEQDLIVKSIYDGARGLMRKAAFKAAIKRFGRIEREFSSHSYADDARIRIAEAFAEMGKSRAVSRALHTLVKRYPGGDMVREALWRLARDAYLKKRYTRAQGYLSRIIKELGRADIYYAQGRALYWRARILSIQGKADKARQAYEQCIRQYPLSFYTLLAFNRLREKHGGAFETLHQEYLSKIGKESGQWRFPTRALFGKPGFLRGVELARLGFGKQAGQELARCGVQIREGQRSANLWIAAVLYDRAGLWHLSHRVPRRLETGYRWQYPLGENFRRWSISYPRAFWSLVDQNAKQAAIPWELILAVMREESGFSTAIESWANAVGLMQLIMPTARSVGKRHNLDITRHKLHDPGLNIKLGATYLGFLHRGFGRALPLAVAGYNAGEGAVLGWLTRFGKVPLDEFLERIPYDQTRRYTKRVLASLLTYRVLHGEGQRSVPIIGQTLPNATLETVRKARTVTPCKKKVPDKKKAL